MEYSRQLLLLLIFIISSAYVYDYSFISTGKTSFADVATNVRIPGCGDTVCAESEYCPADNTSCSDTVCYEPTCENGCELSFVPDNSIDESCFNSTGCSGYCVCNGEGSCVSRPPGQSTTSAGGGTGGPVREPKKDFSINIRNLNIFLYEGQTAIATIIVNNTGNINLEFAVDTTTLSGMVFLSEYAFELNPGESRAIDVVASASSRFKPDIYTGHIIFTAGGIAKSVIAIIDIKSREALFDVLLRVPPEYRRVYQGDVVVFDVLLKNKGNLKPVDVELELVMKNTFNNVISRNTETLAVYDTLNITRNFTLSDTLIPGNYIIYAKAIYQNKTATSSDLISVLEREQVYGSFVYIYKEYYEYWLGAMLIAIILVIIIMCFIIFKKRKTKNYKKHLIKKQK